MKIILMTALLGLAACAASPQEKAAEAAIEQSCNSGNINACAFILGREDARRNALEDDIEDGLDGFANSYNRTYQPPATTHCDVLSVSPGMYGGGMTCRSY